MLRGLSQLFKVPGRYVLEILLGRLDRTVPEVPAMLPGVSVLLPVHFLRFVEGCCLN